MMISSSGKNHQHRCTKITKRMKTNSPQGTPARHFRKRLKSGCTSQPFDCVRNGTHGTNQSRCLGGSTAGPQRIAAHKNRAVDRRPTISCGMQNYSARCLVELQQGNVSSGRSLARSFLQQCTNFRNRPLRKRWKRLLRKMKNRANFSKFH